MATAAAAFAAKARREVEQFFRDHDAFSPEHAVEFEPRMGAQHRYLEQMIAEGIVHQPSDGRYWMDLKAYNALRREKLIWRLRIVGLGAIVALIVAAVQQLG